MSEAIKNTIAKSTALERLRKNREQVLANHREAVSLNEDLEIKALEEEVARRRAKKAGEDRKPVSIQGYSVPSNDVSHYDEEIDRIELLANDTLAEGNVCRGLLVPVAAFSKEAAARATYEASVSTSKVLGQATGLVR